MARFTINGFVIRGFSMGETSRVITLFTREMGKLKGVAKGVRKSASAKGGALELFSHVRCNIYLKENVELGTISSVDLIDDYSDIGSNPLKFGYGSAYCETIDKLTTVDQPVPELYNLSAGLFATVESADSESIPTLFWASFLKGLAITGYEPRLFECAVCSKKNTGRAAFYDPQKGGIICSKELIVNVAYGKLSGAAVKALQSFISEPITSLAGTRYNKKILGEIEQFLMSFADYHTGLHRNLKSFKFLSQLKVN